MVYLEREKVVYGAVKGSIIYDALIADGFTEIQQEETKEEETEGESLNAMKLDELKEIAKELGLSGYSNLKKDELIEIIEPMRQIKGC